MQQKPLNSFLPYYKGNHPSLVPCRRRVSFSPSFHHSHGFCGKLLKLLVPFIFHIHSSSSFSSSWISTCGGFLSLDSSNLVRCPPILLRASPCSSKALRIFCAIGSSIEVVIVSWEVSFSWFVSSILIKRLSFSRIQMGVGTCFLDFDGALMPEKKKPHFH